MLRKLRPRSIYDVFAVLALAVALGGTGAYAANEWNGSNIQDETLTGADIQGRSGTHTAPAVNGTLTGNDISGQYENGRNGTPFVQGSLTGADVFDNTINGADITDNSLASEDVATDSLRSVDIASGGVTSAELAPFTINEGDIASHVIDARHINPGTLNDEDISQGAFVNFQANIGSVPAHSCRYGPVTGVNATKDHLLLTPNFNTTSSFLVYGIEYEDVREQADIKVCNPTDSAIDDGITRFNLLVIDAQ